MRSDVRGLLGSSRASSISTSGGLTFDTSSSSSPSTTEPLVFRRCLLGLPFGTTGIPKNETAELSIVGTEVHGSHATTSERATARHETTSEILSFLSCPLSCAPLIHTPVCKTVTRPAQRRSDDTVRLRGLVTSVYTERVTVRLKEPLQTGRTRARRSYGHRRLAFHTRASAPTSCWAECVCGTRPS